MILQYGISNSQGRVLECVNDINSENQREEAHCEAKNNVMIKKFSETMIMSSSLVYP